MKFSINKIESVEFPVKGYALLRFSSKAPQKGKPGQFVMIRGNWGNSPILPRAFSLVEAGEKGAVLVRQVGEGTKLLCSMQKGDDLAVLGPLGNTYTLPANDQKAILVAGGVGVAPLYFWASHLASQGIEPIFLYGAKTANDLPLKNEIAKIATLIITTEDGSEGERGLIVDPLKRIVEKHAKSVVYSCGPEGLLKAVTKIALNAGCKTQVALESPMACGMGTCKGCAIISSDGSFKYVCSDGPVFDGEAIFYSKKSGVK